MFLVTGKVAVGVGGPAFAALKQKVIGRFRVSPSSLNFLENAFHLPLDGELFFHLREIAHLEDPVEFDRRFDTFCSAFRAVHELWVKRFETQTGKRFIEAVHVLAIQHKRPPTKAELTAYLNCEPSRTSEWCREHGFNWLPTERPGRQD